MKLRKLAVLLLTVILLVNVVGCTGPNQEGAEEGEKYPENWPKSVTMAAGIMGGPWYPLMVKVSEVLMREIEGLNVTVIEGGSLANCRTIQEGVNAQMGLAYANIVYDARNGVYDDTKMTKLLMTNAFMTSYCQFLVPEDSSIQSIEDMFDKRLGSSPRGGGPDLVWGIVLDHYGKTYEDVRAAGGSVSFVNFNEVATLLKDGHLDVGLFTGECPHAAAVEAEMSMPLRPVPIEREVIDEINKKYPYLVAATIPEGSFKGMKGPVETLSIPGVFIVNSEVLPEDFVYEVVKTIMENKDEIVGSFQFVDLLNWDDYKLGISDEVWHPAAKRVYEEHKNI
jgi:TRAP transporter TAXI family solute receptor